MPKRKKPVRLFPKLAKKLFKGKDVFPTGKIIRNNLGSGYFGNFYALQRYPPGKQLVFHLIPLKEDEALLQKYKKYSWALPNSIAHTALFLHPKKKAAVIVCIQETIAVRRLPTKLESRYRNSHLSTLISAITYCRNRKIKLYAVLPENYGEIHNYISQPPLFPKGRGKTIISFYKKTLQNAIKALNINVRRVKTDNVLGSLYSSYFGLELLKLL